MSNEGFDKSLREYFGEYRLRSDSADRLKRMIRAGNETALRRKRRNVGLIAAAFVAAIAAAVGITVAVMRQPASLAVQHPGDTSAAIARDAAMTHVRGFAPDIMATSIHELRGLMTKLDFMPVEPDRFGSGSMALVGGRYMMLEGQPAVALTFRDSSGVPCTLIEARPAEALASVDARTFEIDGVAVDTWREKGLVMILARAGA